MASTPRARLILIVTGSTLRAEEVDRPLGYYLKQRIEEALAELSTELGPFQVLVIADFRWLHEESLQHLPTISLGGPGVNVLAHRWLEELPVSLVVDEQYFIQMDPDLDELRASVWGMNNAETQVAVSAFLHRFLPRFLERCCVSEFSHEDEPDAEADSDDD
jgi:hypothetical protein